MNLKVNQDKCIGCGQCVSICEDVFNFNDEGLAEVIETPIKEEYLEDATNAKNHVQQKQLKKHKLLFLILKRTLFIRIL